MMRLSGIVVVVLVAASCAGLQVAPSLQAPGDYHVDWGDPAQAMQTEQYPGVWLDGPPGYILLDEELRGIRELTLTDDVWEELLGFLWQRRNPRGSNGGIDENPARAAFYDRVRQVEEGIEQKGWLHKRRPRWQSPQGMVYIALGPPDHVEPHRGGGQLTVFGGLDPLGAQGAQRFQTPPELEIEVWYYDPRSIFPSIPRSLPPQLPIMFGKTMMMSDWEFYSGRVDGLGRPEPNIRYESFVRNIIRAKNIRSIEDLYLEPETPPTYAAERLVRDPLVVSVHALGGNFYEVAVPITSLAFTADDNGETYTTTLRLEVGLPEDPDDPQNNRWRAPAAWEVTVVVPQTEVSDQLWSRASFVLEVSWAVRQRWPHLDIAVAENKYGRGTVRRLDLRQHQRTGFYVGTPLVVRREFSVDEVRGEASAASVLNLHAVVLASEINKVQHGDALYLPVVGYKLAQEGESKLGYTVQLKSGRQQTGELVVATSEQMLHMDAVPRAVVIRDLQTGEEREVILRP